MRTLVVPAPLLGLPPAVVGQTVAEAWGATTGRPADVEVALLDDPGLEPSAGGGEVARSQVEVVTVADPWGRHVPATVSLRDGAARPDTTAAAGPQLRCSGDDPAAATSAGVGALVLAALDMGARRVVLPLEDLACHDAGAGLVGALGGRPHATPEDLDAADVASARDRLGGVTVVGRYEDPGPLLGLQGASAVQGPHKGMSAAQAQELERRLGELVDRLRRTVPEPTDLLTGAVVRRDRQPGAGAGGGLGHGVLLLGGTLEEDAPARVRESGLAARVVRADLVVTCTDRFDWRVLRSSVPQVLATVADPATTPVVLVAGSSEAGRREAMALGLAGCYDVVESPRHRAAVLADPRAALHARVARVARTWQPRR